MLKRLAAVVSVSGYFMLSGCPATAPVDYAATPPSWCKAHPTDIRCAQNGDKNSNGSN